MDGILSPQDWINIAWESGFRALAITDFQDVQAFWKAAKAVESLRREAEPEAFDFKILYGLETVLEDGCLIHLLVQNQAGMEQLYRLLEIARQDRERPFLRKTEIRAHRNGLLIGCPGMDGEVFRGIEDHLDDDILEEIGGFYDYLSVLPPCHYQQWSKPGKDFILKISALGKRLGKPVAAASNARVPDMDIFSRTAYCILKDLKQEDFVPGLLGTEEMLDSFSFLEKELAEEIVIHAPNRLADSCETICLLPEDERLLQPILPGAFETIAALCREELQIRYNSEIPVESRERLEYELTILQSSELDSSILLILYRLVHGLRRKGHLIAPRSQCQPPMPRICWASRRPTLWPCASQAKPFLSKRSIASSSATSMFQKTAGKIPGRFSFKCFPRVWYCIRTVPGQSATARGPWQTPTMRSTKEVGTADLSINAHTGFPKPAVTRKLSSILCCSWCPMPQRCSAGCPCKILMESAASILTMPHQEYFGCFYFTAI